MPEPEPFLIFVKKFNELKVPYMVTGSIAGIIYGEPRLTNDIDFVVKLFGSRISALCKAFPDDEFYCPPEDVIRIEASRDTRGNLNIIHHATGFKADLYFACADPLHIWAFAKRRNVQIGTENLKLAPPEYVIVRKIEYFKEGGSDKHVRDIRGILSVSKDIIDMDELIEKIRLSQLEDVWSKIISSK